MIMLPNSPLHLGLHIRYSRWELDLLMSLWCPNQYMLVIWWDFLFIGYLWVTFIELLRKVILSLFYKYSMCALSIYFNGFDVDKLKIGWLEVIVIRREYGERHIDHLWAYSVFIGSWISLLFDSYLIKKKYS